MSMLLLAAFAAAAEPRVTELLRAYIHLHDAQGNVIVSDTEHRQVKRIPAGEL